MPGPATRHYFLTCMSCICMSTIWTAINGHDTVKIYSLLAQDYKNIEIPSQDSRNCVDFRYRPYAFQHSKSNAWLWRAWGQASFDPVINPRLIFLLTNVIESWSRSYKYGWHIGTPILYCIFSLLGAFRIKRMPFFWPMHSLLGAFRV
jgi:hypothetical protein